MTEFTLVLTTMPDDGRADTLARTLVEERLAACVNVHAPMRSTYWWKGQIECEGERQLVIKQELDRLRSAQTAIIDRLLKGAGDNFVVVQIPIGG